MSKYISEYVADFNDIIEECENLVCITRDRQLQQEAAAKLQQLRMQITVLKQQIVKHGDEDSANLLLGFECVATCLHAEISMWLLLKDEKPDEAWDWLVTAQANAVAAVRAHRGFAHLEKHSGRLATIEEVIFPPQVFMSAGLIVGHQECSICGAKYGECDHLAGKPYMGQFCSIVTKDLRADHVAMVDEPADKRCRIVRFSVFGGTRNRMTWKIEPSEVGNTEGEAGATDKPMSMTCEAIIAVAHR